MEMSAVTPMLKTKNLEETIAFYTGVLGFVLENQRNDGPRWQSLMVCIAMRRSFRHVLQHGKSGCPPGPPAMTGVLYFNPKDVKALWSSLKERTAVEWELQEMDYGMLEFAIHDCNGYILSFGQPIEEAA